ncbi:MAG: class II aldolase/adducin family protein [Bacilli bacterium]|nr:class II aldolase/adducin family protein [Bacilli bacterium]
MYTITEAKDLIIKAGLALVEKKLVARTWGNISARISDEEFVITPSGIPYDQVNRDNLVVVKIADCSYEGNVKPSGEKKVHAAIYQNRPDVNFILHTHQNYATAVSVDEIDKPFAPVARYALPSTKKLVKNIVEVLKRSPATNVLLMARHGAIAFDRDYESAFNDALKLENYAQRLYEEVAEVKSAHDESLPYLDDYAQMFGHGSEAVEEDIEAVKLIKLKNTLAARYQSVLRPMRWLDVTLQHFIYKKKYSKLKDQH